MLFEWQVSIHIIIRTIEEERQCRIESTCNRICLIGWTLSKDTLRRSVNRCTRDLFISNRLASLSNCHNRPCLIVLLGRTPSSARRKSQLGSITITQNNAEVRVRLVWIGTLIWATRRKMNLHGMFFVWPCYRLCLRILLVPPFPRHCHGLIPVLHTGKTASRFPSCVMCYCVASPILFDEDVHRIPIRMINRHHSKCRPGSLKRIVGQETRARASGQRDDSKARRESHALECSKGHLVRPSWQIA